MRQFYLQFSLFLLTFPLLGQQADYGVMSQRLQEALRSQPADFHHFSILLSDRVDIRSMDMAFYRNKASLSTRTLEVITALKNKAQATQQPILDLLRSSENVVAESVHPYWVNNVIFLRGKKEIVEQLSLMSEIEWLDLNGQLQLDEYVDVACNVSASPGTPEPGLIAIKADKLWQMGYTGFGTIAMTADTGVDPNHPALSGNWRARTAPQEQTWFNFANPSNPEPSNCNDHGTHTLGTMVGLDRTTDDTVGVAFNAQWIGSDILCTGGTESNVGGFQWALDPDNNPSTIDDMPNVICNSWFDPQIATGEDCMSVYVDLINTMEAAGIAIVFSAGNNGPNVSTVTTPKNINTDLVNVMAVAAVNGNNSNFPVANFSSRGPSTCGGQNSLLIKPEVSAPGVGVRSCSLDGAFDVKDGTSMAAPHVSGAILLLKQAFPELTGSEIKLALYFTCTDLGVAGEDNTYGMGMINVLEAFNYLVDQGNTPVDPLPQHDVMMVDIDAQRLNCDGEATFNLVIENSGSQMLTSAKIEYALVSNGTTVLQDNVDWTGSLASGERESYTVFLDNAPEGAYEISATADEPNGMQDGWEQNNTVSGEEILISETSALQVIPVNEGGDQPCIGSSTLLTVDYDGEAQVSWYFTETGGAPIAEGLTYLVPGLLSDFTFYVGAIVTSNLGIQDFTNSELGDDNEGALVFDVFSEFVLRSVKIYAETPGFRQIVIRDENGSPIAQKVVNLTETGEQRIEMGITIPEGKNYRFELPAGDPFRLTPNAGYPYVIGNVVSIKQSGDFVDPEANYYYFYDWEVVHDHVCGRSAYTVDYLPSDTAPEAEFMPSDFEVDLNDGGEVSFANNSTNSVSYVWDFGDGTMSTDVNPIHTYTAVGTYTVLLTATNVDGCTDVTLETIVVTDEVLAVEQLFDEQAIKVFPNPTSGQLDVRFEFNNFEPIRLELTNMLGHTIMDLGTNQYRNEQISLDLSNLATGVYFLVGQLNEQKFVNKIIKID